MHASRLFAAGERLAQALRPPSVCAICRGWGDSRACASCLARFAGRVPRCGRCALRIPPGTSTCGACLVAPPPFDRAWAAVDYGHPWDALISSFKFHGALDLAPTLARLMVGAREEAGEASEAARAAEATEATEAAEAADAADADDAAVAAEAADAPATAWPAPDWVLPVPLSAERLRGRGYNQAWELARRLARRLGARADPALLLRVRDTAHQLEFPPAERAGNVRAAFAVDPERLPSLRGATVALIDDVMTTGATLAELARVLRRAGAVRIEVGVVARTPRPAER